MERPIDPLDQAAELSQRLNEQEVAAARAAAAPKIVRNPDGTWPYTECECGEDIGEARLNLGFNTCIDCATRAETRNKQFARR